jgi:hypothetical protein
MNADLLDSALFVGNCEGVATGGIYPTCNSSRTDTRFSRRDRVHGGTFFPRKNRF